MRYLTAGESHGPGLTVIIEGVPAGLAVDLDLLNAELKKRQGGYGRGRRMQIESDRVEVRAAFATDGRLVPQSPFGLRTKTIRIGNMSCRQNQSTTKLKLNDESSDHVRDMRIWSVA